MSDYRRFFVDKIDDVITIDGEEFRHAVNVLRIKEGESIILLDNSGYEYTSVVEKINKKDLTAKVVSKALSENEPKTKVALITGYLKGDKTELVVQKAVELGISQIIVFNSKFCSAYMNDNKLARLNKVAVESAKQCKRAVVPKVDYVDNVNDALKSCESYDNKLFACEFATHTEVDFNTLQGSTAIVVGSEGGFSQEEFDLSKEYGYQTIYLGKRILRAETACIGLCAIIMNSLQELK